MRLRATALEDPAARALILRQWTELCERYDLAAPCGEVGALPTGSFAAPTGTFLVGELDGAAVACGGVRTCDGGPPGVGEIKRMYVDKAVRGRGLGRVLLAALEDEARRLGYGRLWLETGTAQPEALHLYGTAGWTPIPRYGEYKNEDDSRCFEKVVGSADEADEADVVQARHPVPADADDPLGRPQQAEVVGVGPAGHGLERPEQLTEQLAGDA